MHAVIFWRWVFFLRTGPCHSPVGPAHYALKPCTATHGQYWPWLHVPLCQSLLPAARVHRCYMHVTHMGLHRPGLGLRAAAAAACHCFTCAAQVVLVASAAQQLRWGCQAALLPSIVFVTAAVGVPHTCCQWLAAPCAGQQQRPQQQQAACTASAAPATSNGGLPALPTYSECWDVVKVAAGWEGGVVSGLLMLREARCALGVCSCSAVPPLIQR
jgi:hypothetical protein